ncbi:nucleoside transporter-domain-containing protein [Mycena metata]|uniref:Nucleoside transporter-domain-containing protein n=1 Tax=Mycena metata TaxID=1033252 RepID=A0AAD7KAI6_9AGAR|nr:nucleoside transporter-domain-containing protein [Mycena metata]
MSLHSPDALYHAVPQAPVAANPVVHSAFEEVEEDADIASDPPSFISLARTNICLLSHHRNVVVDSRIRWIHFVLGCAVLLPWNVMITASPFFLSRLADSPHRLAFGSYLSCAFTISNFIFLARATVTSKQSSPSRRSLVTILSLSFLTFLLTISTFVHPSPGVFFAFVLLNGSIQAALGAYLQTAIIVIASLLGPTAIQAMMSGQAGVAVAVSGVQVFSAVASVWGRSREAIAVEFSSGEPAERSAFIFFSLSTVFLIVSAAAHGWLVTMPAYRTVAGSLERQKGVNESAESDELRGLVSAGRHDPSDEKAQIWRVAKANVIYEVAVSLVFLVTLAVFPAITTSILPTNPNTHPLLFSAVHFLVFNVGDFGGRNICSFPRLQVWSAKRLLTLSLARILFIPLFLLCNLQRPSEAGTPSSAIINSDVVFMLLLFFFGMSNGYVSSLCLMAAPSLEHNPRLQGRTDVDVAATVASFCLVGGLALGSFCSFAVRATVCQCNPFTEN